jgi:hypothetical protein
LTNQASPLASPTHGRAEGEAPSLSEIDLTHGQIMKCPNCLKTGHFSVDISCFEDYASAGSDFDNPIWWNHNTKAGEEHYECLSCWSLNP